MIILCCYSMCFYKGTSLHSLLALQLQTHYSIEQMTNQGKAVFLVLLISLQYAFGNPSGIILQYCIVMVNCLLLIHAVEMKLAHAQDLLGQLATKSAILNGKVVDLQELTSSVGLIHSKMTRLSSRLPDLKGLWGYQD